MRSVTLSQLGLTAGMAVGLLALWAGAAPTVGTGDSAIGGYSKRGRGGRVFIIHYCISDRVWVS